MPTTTPAQVGQILESKRGALALGLLGLGLGFLGWESGRQAEAHAVARNVAGRGQVPDLRLYAYGTPTRPPFRITLGATALDLRPFVR